VASSVDGNENILLQLICMRAVSGWCEIYLLVYLHFVQHQACYKLGCLRLFNGAGLWYCRVLPAAAAADACISGKLVRSTEALGAWCALQSCLDHTCFPGSMLQMLLRLFLGGLKWDHSGCLIHKI